MDLFTIAFLDFVIASGWCLYYFHLCGSFTPVLAGNHSWSQSDSKSPRFSRTFLGILTDLNNSVFYIVSFLPRISSSSSLSFKPLWTVPSAPTTTGMTVPFMFYNLVSFLTR